MVFLLFRLVIGGHGASLVNMVFCKPRTPVILFPLEPNVDQNFAHLVTCSVHFYTKVVEASAMDLDLWLVPSVKSFFNLNYTITEGSLTAKRTFFVVFHFN